MVLHSWRGIRARSLVSHCSVHDDKGDIQYVKHKFSYGETSCIVTVFWSNCGSLVLSLTVNFGLALLSARRSRAVPHGTFFQEFSGFRDIFRDIFPRLCLPFPFSRKSTGNSITSAVQVINFLPQLFYFDRNLDLCNMVDLFNLIDLIQQL